MDFYTGSELNSVTGQYSFSSLDYYALLWFSQSEVAILKHDGFAMGASARRFERANMDRLFGIFGSAEFEQVNGSARDYKIECKRFGRWIDRSL